MFSFLFKSKTVAQLERFMDNFGLLIVPSSGEQYKSFLITEFTIKVLSMALKVENLDSSNLSPEQRVRLGVVAMFFSKELARRLKISHEKSFELISYWLASDAVDTLAKEGLPSAEFHKLVKLGLEVFESTCAANYSYIWSNHPSIFDALRNCLEAMLSDSAKLRAAALATIVFIFKGTD